MPPATVSVGLSFGGIPSTLVIPLDAVIGFADPHIRYGLRFSPIMPDAETAVEPAPSTEASVPAPEPAAAEEAPQVVSLDAFRRRTPPKP